MVTSFEFWRRPRYSSVPESPQRRRKRIVIHASKAATHRGWVSYTLRRRQPFVMAARRYTSGLIAPLGYNTSATSSKDSSVTRTPVVCVSHKSITSRSGRRPVTDATRIRYLNCSGRRDIARRMGVVMGFSVRIGDESVTILRELVADLLCSLQARIPWC